MMVTDLGPPPAGVTSSRILPCEKYMTPLSGGLAPIWYVKSALKALGAAIFGARAKTGLVADSDNVVTATIAARKNQPFFIVRAIPPENSRGATLSSVHYRNVKRTRTDESFGHSNSARLLQEGVLSFKIS